MKKRNFFAGIMFLAAAATIRLAFAQTGLQYSIVTDSSGAVVGQLDPSNIDPIVLTPTSNQQVAVPVITYTPAEIAKILALLPPGTVINLSTLAPAKTDTPKTVNVTVPASVPVAFCSGGNYYNKATGLCADGKFPYKVVPLNSLKDPAAQNPTIVCRAPTVPTWNPAMKKWNCIVPTGFKNTLGE